MQKIIASFACDSFERAYVAWSFGAQLERYCCLRISLLSKNQTAFCGTNYTSKSGVSSSRAMHNRGLVVFYSATPVLYILGCQTLVSSRPALAGRTGRLQAEAGSASPAVLRTVCLAGMCQPRELELRWQTSYSLTIQQNSCMIADLAFRFRTFLL